MFYRLLPVLLLLLALFGGCSGSDQDVIIDVDISGTVRYEDKLYLSGGFTGNTQMKPVRHARVELVGEQGVVATTSSDDAGGYALAGRGSGLYVRVVAQTDGDISHQVEVVPTYLPTQLYAVRSRAIGKSDTVVDIDITLAGAGTVAGVFNILDVYQNAGEFVAARWTGDLPVLQIRWEECSTNGTYTLKTSNPNLTVIALLGVHSNCAILQNPLYNGRVDTDEYDDDVQWHEYGHYLEMAFDTLDSPGSSHSITDLTQDMRLAWSEGWSNFLSGTIKAWLGATYPQRLSTDTVAPASDPPASLYVDTLGTGAFSYDFRSGTLGGTTMTYATNEGAIAKILWGISDDAVFDFSTIWQVFTNHLTVDNGLPSNLEKLWDGWIATGPCETDKISMRTILDERLVFYDNDESESDDLIADAKTLRTGSYTLFSSDGTGDDRDLIPFAVTDGNSYRVETYNLHNGADTYLKILDSDGVAVSIDGVALINDNHTAIGTLPSSPNDTCLLSSRLEFIARQSTTYYAEISSSPDRPVASGRLGDYRLRITENPPLTQDSECP